LLAKINHVDLPGVFSIHVFKFALFSLQFIFKALVFCYRKFKCLSLSQVIAQQGFKLALQFSLVLLKSFILLFKRVVMLTQFNCDSLIFRSLFLLNLQRLANMFLLYLQLLAYLRNDLVFLGFFAKHALLLLVVVLLVPVLVGF